MIIKEDLAPLHAIDRAATIVVWDPDRRVAWRDLLHAKLGAERASQITVVCVDSMDKALAHLAGRLTPVYIALDWYHRAGPRLRDLVDRYAAIANSRPPAPRLERTTRFV